MIKINGTCVYPTIFPDKTSQVWKVDGIKDSNYVTWKFQSEAELFHLMQLSELLRSSSNHLLMPYLPYARQDKDVDNNATFALTSFAKILNLMRWDNVTCFDVHSRRAIQLINNAYNWIPSFDFMNKRLYDIVVFPDNGAYQRYKYCKNVTKGRYVVCEKTRCSSTGYITGYTMLNDEGYNFNGCSVLVVDDLCDGGATFLILGDKLKKMGAVLDLYVSHGLFSKGFSDLLTRYQTIITTNSTFCDTLDNMARQSPHWTQVRNLVEQKRLIIQEIF